MKKKTYLSVNIERNEMSRFAKRKKNVSTYKVN